VTREPRGRSVPSRAPQIAWRLASVVDVVTETPRARTLVLDVPDWPGHRAGQHVDVRVTAEDGYQAQRSFSIASAPEDVRIALTVQRLDDGEVSPYLTDGLRAGDRLELIRDGQSVAEIMSIWSTLLPLDAVMEGARAGELVALCAEHAELEMRCRTGFPTLQHFHQTHKCPRRQFP
jgi:hypothetical protein